MIALEFREWRLKLGLTQGEVARRFKVSRVTVGSWENGTSPISGVVEQLCAAYLHRWKQEEKRRPEYGPVKLYYCGHYGRGISPAPQTLPNSEAAIREAMEVSAEERDIESFITTLDGDDIWNIRELKEEMANRRAAKGKEIEKQGLAERLMEIGRHFSSLPKHDERSPDEIIGYDEFGLPK